MSDEESQKVARARLGMVLRGKYRLDRVLGIGGMATVYAATHRNRKRFAIKMLHPELSARENIRTRFLREGYVANSVDHTGAVAVLDDDVAEDGSAFLVMELLEGGAVDEVLARYGKTMPLGLALSIGDALLDVLASAHAKGIVHRDIKPANVFLTDDGRIEVLDFGIARLHDESTSAASATQTGATMGTPAFMAPEQALGEVNKVDGQTDVWAVGATLFTLLTGELVHQGENASQLLVFAATRKARPLASVAAEVPAAVAEVIDKALAFEKKERWAGAKEMREALGKACLAATGAAIAPLPKTERVTGLEDTIAPMEGSWGSGPSAPGSRSGSGNVGFDATVDAASGAPSAPRAPALTTNAPLVDASRASSVAARKGVPWRALGGVAGACALVAGGAYAYRAAHAPRVRYCRTIEDTNDGPRCGLPVGPEVAAKRGSLIARVTEVGGHVTAVEYVNFAGLPIDPTGQGVAMHWDVVRDAAGAVQEVIRRDRHGVISSWERWSEGGKRIDLVDIDGKTPRRLGTSRATSERIAFDERGLPAKVAYLGPTGRPREGGSDPLLKAVYGLTLENGKTPGTVVRAAVLAADGQPGADATGIAVLAAPDDGKPGGSDSRLFDLDGHPFEWSGVHRWHTSTDANGDQDGESFFGTRDEPTIFLQEAFHEYRLRWDPAKRVHDWTIYDEHGRPQVVRDQWFSALRKTNDERGRLVLIECLDEQGNRVMLPKSATAYRYTFDEHDDVATVEMLDPASKRMPGGQGFARQEMKHDAHGNTVEARYFDAAGHLAPTNDGGAIVRDEYDNRDLRLTRSNFDADGRPFADPHGVFSERDKYDRMRNLVEEATFGVDGQPVANDEGFATKRYTYDENDDLVAVAYFDASGAPALFRGEYATHRTKNDERGLAVEDAYLDGEGEPVLRKEGYASVKRTLDRNGDAVEESYFGKRGEAVLREGGYATKKTTYDVHRRPSEVALFDVSGQPVSGADGWAIERTTYDERGLVARVDHQGASKAPSLDKAGRASVTRSYDTRGNMREETSLGVDGKPIATPEGYATKKITYDDRDEVIEESLLGADGTPAMGDAGWSLRRLRYDDSGNNVEEAFLDAAHQPVAPKGMAYASIHQRFDERHRLAETSFLDPRGAPVRGGDGAAIVAYGRDAYGHVTETKYFDGARVPSPSSEGKITVRASYDVAGRLMEERFVDAAGAPLVAKDGCAGHRAKYDAEGRKVEESCLDAKDGLALSEGGWAIRRTLHDGRGNPVDVATYAPDGSLRADKEGIARRKSRYDERNLVQETAFWGVNDKPARDKRGASGIRFTYDDAGKKTGELPFDERGAPAPPALKPR